jgi:fatty acid desaturase
MARRAKEAQRNRRAARRTQVQKAPSRLQFGRRSLILFAVGVASIAVGYALLAAGSITLAPILLVAGYCVFFPMGILMGSGATARGGGE